MVLFKKNLYKCVSVTLIALLLSGCVKSSNDYVNDYLKIDVPLIYSDFSIFPSSETICNATINEYQSITKSTLMFDDVIVWLGCTYSDLEYDYEIERIQSNNAEYREDIFQFPAYVMLYSGKDYEYALLMPEKNTIVYVFAQTVDLNYFESFPKVYYPNTNKEIDICHYYY